MAAQPERTAGKQPGSERKQSAEGSGALGLSPPDFAGLPIRTRRRLMLRALARAVLTVTLLVALYYLLPMDHAIDSATIAVLVVGLLAFAVLVSWQVREILRADYPAVKAVEALAAAVPLFLLVFAATYFLMGRADRAAFTQPLNRTDALYFTVTVFATVGFGDITAVTQSARIVVIVQMLGDLLVLGLLIRLILNAVQTSQQRSAIARGPDEPVARAAVQPERQPGSQEDR